MRLVQFSVTNFRSITSAHRIDFSDVTVLLGKNNEGKSNLLRALHVAMRLLSWHTKPYRHRTIIDSYAENIYSWQRDYPIQIQDSPRPKHTILRLDFSLDDAECQEFKEAIASSINGSLALEIKIGKEGDPKIRFVKSGKNTKSLDTKSDKIAKFVADRIHFNYIPAVRTDSTTIELINGLLSQELKTLEKNQAYENALKNIADLQKPILDRLAKQVQGPLKEFLPNIKSVKLEITELNRRLSLRRDVSVIIDDGTETSLEHKGDGVKSLAALGLLKSKSAASGASLLAIEEPESHLHPSAIHQVSEIIKSISENSQVIITTHNPLFVDRENIKANVIVTEGGAKQAKDISMIREVLGVKASDNLQSANYVLLVEGEHDAKSLKALLPALSDKIAKALKSNMLIIEPLNSASKLSFMLSFYRGQLCATYSFLDDDQAGNEAVKAASQASLISSTRYTLSMCEGMKEAELEDCINTDIYRKAILDQLGVDIFSPKFKGNKKWSTRMESTFKFQGKTLSEKDLSISKQIVVDAILNNPKIALNDYKRNSIDALIEGVENMLKT